MSINRIYAITLFLSVSQIIMPWGQKRSMPEVKQEVVVPDVREELPMSLRDACHKMSEDVTEGYQAFRKKLSHAAETGSDWAVATWLNLKGEHDLQTVRSYKRSISEYDSIPWPIVTRLAHATAVTGISKFAYDRMALPEGRKNFGKIGQYSVGLLFARYIYLELRNMNNTVRIEWE